LRRGKAHFGFFGGKHAEIGGRTDERPGAKVGQARFDRGISEAQINFTVELVDDFRRCVPRRANTLLNPR